VVHISVVVVGTDWVVMVGTLLPADTGGRVVFCRGALTASTTEHMFTYLISWNDKENNI
jgi:hypothetical protein